MNFPLDIFKSDVIYFFCQNISKYFNDVLVFSQYGLACKYEIIFQMSIYFVIPGVTITDQARL